jgi:Family of unknown function (DUF6152)
MKTAMKSAAGMCAVIATFSMGAARAHHSFAMFDKTKSVTLTGTIKNVEWINPHVWLWIYVPDRNGGQDVYGLETGGPSQMPRMGLKRSMLKPGDKIAVEIFPMKDGTKGGQLSKATLADGYKVDVLKSVKAFGAGGKIVEQSEVTGAPPAAE